MSMDAPTPSRAQGQSNIKLQSPPVSPRNAQDLLDAINLEPYYLENKFAKAEAQREQVVEVEQQTSETPNTPQSPFPQPCQRAQEAPPTPEDSGVNWEAMSPTFQHCSTTSSPQNTLWLHCSDSEERQAASLQVDLLQDQSPYTHSPSTPPGSWDCTQAYQFHGAPTSVGMYQDYSIPFSASTPPMQPGCSPAFELASVYGSPQFPTSHFEDASFLPQHPDAVKAEENTSRALHHRLPTAVEGDSDNCTTLLRRPTTEIKVSKGNDNNNLPYSQLLFRAFLSSNTRRMQLKDIYQWFRENTNKTGSKGWQNSIRHNLSMNHAFQKAELKEGGSESRRSTEWVLCEWALQRGVESTTRYRKGTAHERMRRPGRSRGPQASYGNRAEPNGYGLHGRERLLHQRMQLHGMPPHASMLYGSPVASMPSPVELDGLPTMDMYNGPTSATGYSPSCGLETLNSPESYTAQTVDGSMGDYAIAGGMPDNTFPGGYSSGVLPAMTSVPMSIGPLTSAGLPEYMTDACQYPMYVPAEYSSGQQINIGSEGPCEWVAN